MVRAINATNNQLFTFDVYSQAKEVVFCVSLSSPRTEKDKECLISIPTPLLFMCELLKNL